jgi:hypothetical protein
MDLPSETKILEVSLLAGGTRWNGLFNIAGIAAVTLLVYSLVTMVLLMMIGGSPETALEGFNLLQENRLIGLLRLDLLTILAMPLYYVLLVGAFAALRNTQISYALLAFVLGCAGVTLVLATPSALSFLTLSDQFASASSEGAKTMLLGAGEAILASDLWHGSGAIIGGLILQTSLLIISLIMLSSRAFSKLTAWLGILTHGLDMLHILVAFFLPVGGVALMMIAGPLYLVWFPLLARDFFRLGWSTPGLQETI